MDNLPSIGQMLKLIVVLVLAAFAIFIVLKIVEMLIPFAIIIIIGVGVYYLYQKMQEDGKAKRA